MVLPEESVLSDSVLGRTASACAAISCLPGLLAPPAARLNNRELDINHTRRCGAACRFNTLQPYTCRKRERKGKRERASRWPCITPACPYLLAVPATRQQYKDNNRESDVNHIRRWSSQRLQRSGIAHLQGHYNPCACIMPRASSTSYK